MTANGCDDQHWLESTIKLTQPDGKIELRYRHDGMLFAVKHANGRCYWVSENEKTGFQVLNRISQLEFDDLIPIKSL